MTVRVRFAPSPTGFLHIGGARTALFNWAFARHHKGQFLLRIEDTDRARSKPEAIEAIFAGLNWLGLTWDEEPVYQHKRAARHNEVINQLLANGYAYKCTCTPEEVEAMRARARAAGEPPRYDGTCRDREHDPQSGYVIRFKAPQTGETMINDLVQGTVSITNDQLDDLVLQRSDGTPTYMLCVVVDDYDMAISHIIRGDDHLTNTFRQVHIYKALDWTPPQFAHISLIHGTDGTKLSKRHGALGVEAYEEQGFLPEALCNYLARLGWSHGDDEIFSRQDFVNWFTLTTIGKSPARFDLEKLQAVNAHYIHKLDINYIIKKFNYPSDKYNLINNSLEFILTRVNTLPELQEELSFLFAPRPLMIEDALIEKHFTAAHRQHLSVLLPYLKALKTWNIEDIKQAIEAFLQENELKLGKIGPSIRVALTGKTAAPGIYELFYMLGQDEAINRISDKISDN